MALARKTRPYWHCRRCGFRNLRANVKCRGEGCEGRRPKRPQFKHAAALQGDTYPLFVQAARDIHGVTDESCCACGKPRKQERRHDRDHDHVTGHCRGLLCPGNTGCNIMLPKWMTAAKAHAIAKAARAHDEDDWERWEKLAAYLWRVERFYAAREAVA